MSHVKVSAAVVSSSLACSTKYAEIAQLVEQLICNQQVAGSIPVFSSNKIQPTYMRSDKKTYERNVVVAPSL